MGAKDVLTRLTISIYDLREWKKKPQLGQVPVIGAVNRASERKGRLVVLSEQDAGTRTSCSWPRLTDLITTFQLQITRVREKPVIGNS